MENKSTNRSFGILFSIVFLIITFWPLLNEKSPYYWFLAPSLIFLILDLLNSKLLGPFNSAWIKLGNILGMIVIRFGVIQLKKYKKEKILVRRNYAGQISFILFLFIILIMIIYSLLSFFNNS